MKRMRTLAGVAIACAVLPLLAYEFLPNGYDPANPRDTSPSATRSLSAGCIAVPSPACALEARISIDSFSNASALDCTARPPMTIIIR